MSEAAISVLQREKVRNLFRVIEVVGAITPAIADGRGCAGLRDNASNQRWVDPSALIVVANTVARANECFDGLGIVRKNGPSR